MNMKVEIVPVERDTVGESPVWDAASQSLYWIDQPACRVRCLQPVSGTYREWAVPQAPGAIGLAGPGRLVAALSDGFYGLDLTSGTCELLAAVEHAGPDIHMNDGRCDRSGRFVAGSGLLPRNDLDCCVYRLSDDGHVEVLQRGVNLTNGVCFSPRGDRLYFADSRAGMVMACDYDAAGSAVGPARPFADTRSHGSVPDGATVDAEGAVWVALIQSGRVLRFLPDGALDREIELPLPHPTSVCFGGAELGVLYVTSLRVGGRLRSDHPSAGALAAVSGLGVRGVVEGHFGAMPHQANLQRIAQ